MKYKIDSLTKWQDVLTQNEASLTFNLSVKKDTLKTISQIKQSIIETMSNELFKNLNLISFETKIEKIEDNKKPKYPDNSKMFVDVFK
jgi:hypothetical protein